MWNACTGPALVWPDIPDIQLKSDNEESEGIITPYFLNVYTFLISCFDVWMRVRMVEFWEDEEVDGEV